MSTTALSPTVPVHLQSRILNYLDTSDPKDLIFLWTTIRNVSTAFRAVAEDMVQKRHLKHTRIQYDFGPLHREGTGRSFICIEFTFKNVLPDDPKTAVFKAKIAKESKTYVKEIFMSETLSYKEKFHEPPHYGILQPPHSVLIRRGVNDTEIPDLEIDYDTFSLSCDWKGMFTAFCYEDKLLETYGSRRKGEFHENVEGLRDPSTKKHEMDSLDKFFEFATACVEQGDNDRRKARRRRIRRQFARVRKEFQMKTGRNGHDSEVVEEAELARRMKQKDDEDEGSEVDPDEEDILKRLKDLTVGCDHLKFPDEPKDAEYEKFLSF